MPNEPLLEICRSAIMAAAFMAGLLLGASLHAQELVTEDGPPLNMEQGGRIVGVATEKLEEAFRRIGKHPTIQLLPWSRAYQMTLDNPNYCIYSTAFTPEREKLFKWVGPLASDDWVLYKLADNPNKLTRIEDIKDDVIGAMAKGALATWLTARGYKIDAAPYDRLNPAKLVQGRSKYWVSTASHSKLLLNQLSLTDKIVPVLVFGHFDMYLACNVAVSDGLIQQLNGALHAMRDDGTSKRIESKYGW